MASARTSERLLDAEMTLVRLTGTATQVVPLYWIVEPFKAPVVSTSKSASSVCAARAAVTKAVVALLVVLSPAVAVGCVGMFVNAAFVPSIAKADVLPI